MPDVPVPLPRRRRATALDIAQGAAREVLITLDVTMRQCPRRERIGTKATHQLQVQVMQRGRT